MKKVVAVFLTTGLLLGAVAFGALAQGRETEARECQKPGKACCCEREQPKEEPAPWAKTVVDKNDEPAPWESQSVVEKEQPGCCECCRGEMENPPSPGTCDHWNGNWRGEHGMDCCGRKRERPGCHNHCHRVNEGNSPSPGKCDHCRAADGEWQGEPCQKRCGWEQERASHAERVHRCERCDRLLEQQEDESAVPAQSPED